MRRINLFFAFILSVGSLSAQPWTLVTYNAENIFDADGIAAYDDYKTPGYTPRHVLTKVRNVAQVMAKYNDGQGADVIVFNEFEADQSQSALNSMTAAQFLQQWSGKTLEWMFGEGFSPAVADIPSELLVLKAMDEAGMSGYEVVTGYAPLDSATGKPTHAIKNVIFSRLPVKHELTRRHEIEDARPILEVWLDVAGHDLAVFANHWKSGASNPQMELARVQNATVLKARLDELRAVNPAVDFILAGDFNSDYNQSQRYGGSMPQTGISTVLKSSGNEMKIASGSILPNDMVYNLWYELPVDQRGSDHFRGYWGTLMQMMISPGMYNQGGVSYIDNSFELGRFLGFNAYTHSGTPIRWSSFGEGYGYADHFPISMEFTVTGKSDVIELNQPSKETDDRWAPIPVMYTVPSAGQYIDASSVSGSLRTAEYFDKMFLVTGNLVEANQIVVNGERYELYSPSFRIQDAMSGKVGTDVTLFGRLGQFRGRWQIVVESEGYLR
jgi:hypothetical protein